MVHDSGSSVDAGRIEAAPAVCFNASILSNMCFFVVMLCPVPLMFYIDSVQQGRYRKVYHVAECITCVNFVLCTSLQLLNIADFISTMFLSHLVIAGTFLTIFITICRDLIKERRNITSFR